tara:strand:+ start:1303 stop:1851 length:549 start_codon:yes stop_codon:yes gene_type:complete
MSFDSYISNGEQYDLSSDDVMEITDNKYKFILYHDLEKYNNIDEVLGQNKGVILLFQNENHDSGHWVSLWLDDDTLYFWDSYGLMIDEELKYTEFTRRIHEGKIVPHLTHLVEQSNYKVISNTYRYQKFKTHVNTCGRFCATRLKMRDTSEEEFKKLLTKNKYYDADFWITVLTMHYGISDI